jgi:8-oxo-dGTP diphosphatase
VAGKDEAPRRRRLTRAEAKAKTRDQLLDAAARVFAQKGYAGASVEEIAESAGYSTGALYSNFDSKEQLFLELMSDKRSRGIARQAAKIEKLLAEDPVAGEELLALLTRRLERVAGKGVESAPLQAEFWLYAVRNPEAMQMLAAKTAERVDVLAPLVARAMREYQAEPEIPPEAVTRVILALYRGLARQRRIDPAAIPADLLSQALRWLLAGMGTAAAGTPATARAGNGTDDAPGARPGSSLLQRAGHGDLVQGRVGGKRLALAGRDEPAALVEAPGGLVALGDPEVQSRGFWLGARPADDGVDQGLADALAAGAIVHPHGDQVIRAVVVPVAGGQAGRSAFFAIEVCQEAAAAGDPVQPVLLGEPRLLRVRRAERVRRVFQRGQPCVTQGFPVIRSRFPHQHHGHYGCVDRARRATVLFVDVTGLVASIGPLDAMERGHRAATLDWLASTPDIYRRVKPGTPSPHLVSYAVLADPADWSVFLVDHRLAGLWLPAGGHVEPFEDPLTTARREAMEELGVDIPATGPVFVTVTSTTGPDPHIDVSLWYLLTADRSLPITLDAREFAGGRWWPPAEIAAAGPAGFDPHMGRFLAKMRA